MNGVNKEDTTSMEIWCSQNGLTSETRRVLEEEGFSSLRYLSLLSVEEVERAFQATRRLPLAQSMALKHALKSLNSPQGQSGDTQVSPPEANRSHPDTTMRPQEQSGSEPKQGTTAPESPFNVCDELPDQTYRFLLVGKTGSGKSTTGNNILGADLFDADVAFDSQTKRNQLKRRVVNGVLVEMMDSPGLFDTSRSPEEISVSMVQAVACLHPGPHAILYVIRLGRYTEEEHQVYKRLKALLDDHVTQHVIVILTGGDDLEKEGKSLKEALSKVPPSLNQVLAECQHRVVLFNNVSHDVTPYVRNFFREVDKLMLQTGTRPYQCPKYALVAQGMDKEVARRLEELERQDLASKPYVKQLQSQTQAAEAAVIEERRLFEEREAQRQQTVKAEHARAQAELQELQAEMQRKKVSMEQQKEQREKLVQRHRAEEERLQRDLARQREEEAKRVQEKEKEMQRMVQLMEKQQQAILASNKEVERQMAQLKDRIAQEQDSTPTVLDKLVDGGVGILLTKVASMVL